MPRGKDQELKPSKIERCVANVEDSILQNFEFRRCNCIKHNVKSNKGQVWLAVKREVWI